MGHYLALEHPDLDTAGAVGRARGGHAIIDIGAQRVQRHPAFAVPLHAGDFRPAQPPAAIDANTLRAQPHSRLDRPLHRPAKRHPALELLGNVLGNKLGVDLGLADLDDVHMHVGPRHPGDITA